MTRLGEGVPQRADDQAAHQGRIAEADLRLGRMDVDVHFLRVDFQEQRQHGVAVAGQEIGVGSAHGADQQLVADRAAVDEQVLVAGGRAVERRQADMAGQADLGALGQDGDRVVGELPPHQGAEPGQAGVQQLALGGGQANRGASLVRDGEGDVRMGHRQTFDRIDGVVELGALGCFRNFRRAGVA